jgi:hypothetical protein
LGDRGDVRLLGQFLRDGGLTATPAQEVGVDARDRPPIPRLERGIVREGDLELVDAIRDPDLRAHLLINPA